MRTTKLTVEVFINDRFHTQKTIAAPLTKDFRFGWIIDKQSLQSVLQQEFPYSYGRKGVEMFLRDSLR